MTIESASYLSQLDATYPATGDQVPEGDDHIRQIKAVLKATFPGRGGPDLRVLAKAATFTPATTEVGAVFHCTGSFAITFAAVAGLPDGTHYLIKAANGTITLTPSAGDTIDVATLVPGDWGILVRTGTGWIFLKTPTPTAAAIVAALGATAVAHASWADSAPWAGITGKPGSPNIAGNWIWAGQDNLAYLWGSSDGVNHYPVNRANLSVNYANVAGSASNADTLDGYHSYNLPYMPAGSGAPLTAFVDAYVNDPGAGGGPVYLTLTRANGATVVLQTGALAGSGGGG